MQTSTSVCNKNGFERKLQKEVSKRLTPSDYSEAGIVKQYDWSVKDREDKEMERYRKYLMKLCLFSHEIDVSVNKKVT